MKVLFDLGHPAHYHLVKHVAQKLSDSGIEIHFSIQKKDVLEELIKETSFGYKNILPNGRKPSKYGLVKSFITRFVNLLLYTLKIKPQLLVGTSAEISYIGKLLNIPSFNLCEDDAKIVPLHSNMAYPLATEILTPISCDNGRWNKKSIKYDSYQKLAYLHPNYFSPNEHILRKYNINRPYSLIRFSKLSAHHDYGIKGIDEPLAIQIINILLAYGSVYLSSEKVITKNLDQYRLSIDPRDIHHILYFAKILISDSQSMTVEAAVLGTPSIRFSSFAGKIGVLEELEHKYELTYGIKPEEPEKLLNMLIELLNIKNIEDIFKSRRQKMLADKIDVTSFFVWMIQNYPNSKLEIKNNPEIQYHFK